MGPASNNIRRSIRGVGSCLLLLLMAAPALAERAWVKDELRLNVQRALENYELGWKNEKLGAQLAAAMQRLRGAEQGRLVLVTGMTPTTAGEGKTTTAVSLARVAALSGERVVLVDCDLRRSSVQTALRAPAGSRFTSSRTPR